MRKTLSLLLAAVMCTFCLTGCVKIIDKGTEGEYTGEVAFDAAADSSSDWEQVVAEITEKAAVLRISCCISQTVNQWRSMVCM